jgi:hypothetical protein
MADATPPASPPVKPKPVYVKPTPPTLKAQIGQTVAVNLPAEMQFAGVTTATGLVLSIETDDSMIEGKVVSGQKAQYARIKASFPEEDEPASDHILHVDPYTLKVLQ